MKFHPANERTKHHYFRYLKEAGRLDEQSIDTTAKAIGRFEDFTNRRDFSLFRTAHASAFKVHLLEQRSAKGLPLSKSTIVSTLKALKRFFSWLPGQTGYKTRLRYEWAEYFNPSLKDLAIARAHRERRVPTIEQVLRVVRLMPGDTPMERRDRALVALIALTGARDNAVASLRMKHIDIADEMIFQDGRDVRTKFSKTISTWFFPVGEDFERIISEWVIYLREELGFGAESPLFPQTVTTFVEGIPVTSLGGVGWATASPIRGAFKAAFEAASMPYFNPHSFRHMLVQLGMEVCTTPEQFKAWSQNLGHDGVLTTFNSYGDVPSHRQRDLIRGVMAANADEAVALQVGRVMLEAGRAVKSLPTVTPISLPMMTRPEALD